MNAVSIFAGAGGFDLGARAVGIEVLRSVEFNADACATLAAAGFHPVCGDVGAVAEWGADVGPIDLLFGGPPCQPFSVAGKGRGSSDLRDGFPLALIAARLLRPTWTVLENVSGFMGEAFAAYRQQLLSDLRGIFAHVQVWRLDASDFGVPQRRKRCFIVCGPARVRAPQSTHARSPTLGLWAGPASWHGWDEVLRLPPNEHLATSRRWEDGTRRHKTIPRGRPAGTVTTQTAGGQPWERSGCNYVVAASTTPNHEPTRRPLTVAESACLQAFPAGYPFQGSASAQARQVGNAVPPPLGEAVLRQVLAAHLRLTTQPHKDTP